jgi:hypothetical protein
MALGDGGWAVSFHVCINLVLIPSSVFFYVALIEAPVGEPGGGLVYWEAKGLCFNDPHV